jgi:acyl carrier protein phosphodiesterase
MKLNQTTLDKLEAILEESGYIVRYERGTFQSGYCILEQRKVVVLNKFMQMEGRINTMLDLIPQLNVHFDALTVESQKLYDEVMALAATKESEK